MDQANNFVANQGYGFFTSLVIGLIAGWLAEQISRSDHGILTNLIMGVLGALTGGLIASFIGITNVGFIGHVIIATLGALLIIFLYRALRGRTSAV